MASFVGIQLVCTNGTGQEIGPALNVIALELERRPECVQLPRVCSFLQTSLNWQRGSSGVSGPLCSVQALEQMKKM